jgi:hypothetical protein
VRLGWTVVALAAAAFALQYISIGTADEALSVSDAIARRFEDLMAAGIAGSSRSVWAELLATQRLPLVGYGFGNANVVASSVLGSDLVVSYVSLYMNVLFATGIIGLALLCAFLFHPLLPAAGRAVTRREQAFLMGYIACLVAFIAGSEELSVPFGVIAGLLHQARADARAGAHAVVGATVEHAPVEMARVP